MGVRIAAGSDRFRSNVVAEMRALARPGIFDNRELLRMWAVDTSQAICSERKIGSLSDGAEASSLALDGNPLVDFANTSKPRLRVKNGRMLGDRWAARRAVAVAFLLFAGRNGLPTIEARTMSRLAAGDASH